MDQKQARALLERAEEITSRLAEEDDAMNEVDSLLSILEDFFDELDNSSQKPWLDGVVWAVNFTAADSRNDHMDLQLADLPAGVDHLVLARAILMADEGNVLEVVYFATDHPYLRVIDLQAGENYRMADARYVELAEGGTMMRPLVFSS